MFFCVFVWFCMRFPFFLSFCLSLSLICKISLLHLLRIKIIIICGDRICTNFDPVLSMVKVRSHPTRCVAVRCCAARHRNEPHPVWTNLNHNWLKFSTDSIERTWGLFFISRTLDAVTMCSTDVLAAKLELMLYESNPYWLMVSSARDGLRDRHVERDSQNVNSVETAHVHGHLQSTLPVRTDLRFVTL